MRVFAILAVAAVLVGCSTTPEPSRRPKSTTVKKAADDTYVVITPNVGANVEDARRPGVLYCAKCGSATDKTGACPCNKLGMPGFGITPVGRARRSTSPR